MTFRKVAAALGGVAIVGVVAFVGIVEFQLHRRWPAAVTAPTGAALAAKIERGRYVAYAADCAACHTAPGGEAFAGGYALRTPFGLIRSSNITSDPKTGIGGWSQAQFDKALRHGIGSHGYLYPAMPYNDYARMTDQDADDLWAYVRTIPAVDHKVVENALPFPYDQRWLLFGWNLLFFHQSVFKPDPARSAEVNRGAYLVDGAGHCGACHTAKNALGGDRSAYLQGGTLEGWHAPDLSTDPRTGLGGWSEAEIVDYLQTGANAHAVAAGPMVEAVENSTQHLTDPDLHAIAAYLKQVPGGTAPAPQPMAASDHAMVLGKAVYASQCEACHTASGQGVANMIPALAGAPAVNAQDPSSLLHMVLIGGYAASTAHNPTGAGMPRFDWKLSDAEIAGVVTYIRNSWGNAASAVDASAVTGLRTEWNTRKQLGH